MNKKLEYSTMERRLAAERLATLAGNAVPADTTQLKPKAQAPNIRRQHVAQPTVATAPA